MRRLLPVPLAVAFFGGTLFFATHPAVSQEAPRQLFPVSPVIGDERLLTQHVDEAAIEQGRVPLSKLIEFGKFLFDTAFTEADGVCRPAQNGTFPALNRTPRTGAEAFNRISGPEADSCSGCHNKPRSGGGGDNVGNVFVQGQRFSFFNDPSLQDENGLSAPGSVQGAADERNTLGMWGSGAIEMLAREMTADLLAIRDRAKQQAMSSQANVTLPLVTKDVSFGQITAHADGTVDTGGVEGVDTDLIIKPFSQKGVVNSLRTFTNNAYFHHHGLQSVERFGLNTDPDGDGVTNELSVGDITASTIFQASLAVPGQVIPRNPRVAAAIARGEAVFSQVGCGSCHKPQMTLNSPVYTEPNPYNPAFNLRVQDVSRLISFDLTKDGELPRLERVRGTAVVRAFTDLKRHNLGNDPLINNEKVVQAGVPTNVFITKKLWGFYSEPHFLHNGCSTMLTSTILAHGGEAQASRDAYAALSEADRRSVIEFLKSLRVLPEGSRSLTVDEFGLPRAKPH